MKRQWIKSFTSVLLASALLSGCVFQRTVVNDKSRDLDLSFIQIGTTTWEDVLENLGPPDVPIKNIRVLQYRHSERRTSMFRITYFVFLPWAWYDDQVEEKLVIELDEKGVVSHVARSKSGTIRPPLEGEGDRPELETEIIRGGKA